jgi:hypothetical protein
VNEALARLGSLPSRLQYESLSSRGNWSTARSEHVQADRNGRTFQGRVQRNRLLCRILLLRRTNRGTAENQYDGPQSFGAVGSLFVGVGRFADLES